MNVSNSVKLGEKPTWCVSMYMTDEIDSCRQLMFVSRCNFTSTSQLVSVSQTVCMTVPMMEGIRSQFGHLVRQFLGQSSWFD